MGQDDLDDAFAFVNRAEAEPGPLRPRVKPRGGAWKVWLIAAVGLSLHGVILAAFLNFIGIVPIPRLAGFTRERLMPGAPALVPAPAPALVGPPLPTVGGDRRRPDRPAPRASAAPRPTSVARAEAPATGAANRPRRSLQALRNPPPVDQVAAAPSPIGAAEALLKAKGIAGGTSATVLEAEATTHAKLVTLRAQANEFNEAYDRLAAIRTSVVQLQELDEQINMTNANIAELNFQMAQFRSYSLRGIVYHGNTTQENDVYETLRANRLGLERGRDTGLIPTRNRLRGQQPGREVEARATATFDLRKAAGLAALRDLRDAITTAKQGYASLSNDPQVVEALAMLGQARLAPSPDFLADVKALGQYEKSLGLKPTFP